MNDSPKRIYRPIDHSNDYKRDLLDSQVFNFFITEQYDSIVNLRVRFDDDLLIGLRSASLSHLGKFDLAQKAIPLYEEMRRINDSLGDTGEHIKIYGLMKYPQKMGDYQIFAIHQLFLLRDGVRSATDNWRYAADMRQKDCDNPIGIVDFYFLRYSLDSGKTALRLYDSLLKIYPKWNSLKERKAIVLAAQGYDSNVKAIATREELLKRNYHRERQMDAIKYLKLANEYYYKDEDKAIKYHDRYYQDVREFLNNAPD